VAALVLLVGAVFLAQNLFGSDSESVSDINSEVIDTVDSTLPPIDSEAGKANWDALAGSVVFIEALDPCNWRGSGTLVLDGSYVLTNEHVAYDGSCALVVGLTDGLSSEPSGDLQAIVVARDAAIDLAVLRLIDSSGNPIIPTGHSPVTIDYNQPSLGSKLTTLGYPALGSYEAGMTITFTSGDFAGIDNSDGEFYKTTAQMRGGVSGGAAFNERGLFIGIPTAGLIEEDTGEAVGINLIRPAKYAKPLLEQAQSNPLDTSGVRSSSNSGGGGYDETQTDPRFRTCKDAKANGYGPYYSGFDPEYDWYIDADSDGKVCE
jgi:S1-C subfamily serine protease